MEPDFNFYQMTNYSVDCESCGLNTGPWSTRFEARTQAKRNGFVAVQTPEEGTLNFCRSCSVELKLDAPKTGNGQNL